MAYNPIVVAGTFPDAEDVAKSVGRGVLVDGRPVARVGRETKAGQDLDGGTIRIERIGGQPDRDELADNPILEMAFFGRDLAQAQAIRDAWRDAVREAVGEEVHAGVVLDLAVRESGPIRPPWSTETSTRRLIENWRLSYRPITGD